MSIRDDIYNYEARLSDLKRELNEMTKMYLSNPSSNSKLLSSKITSMKNEILAINYQLDLLKVSLPNIDNSMQQPNSENVVHSTNLENATTNSRQPNNRVETSTFNQTPHKNTAKQNSKDLENTIGKSFMGILASILIFISFILFAKLLYPILTEAIKILAMYLISGAFTAFGLLKLKKKPNNKLYLSITGCGVGALYISLILSNIYFKVIGDITLYLLIFAWAIFTAYLSRLRSNVFSIIGQAGISIALIFGNALCYDTDDINKFFVLNIFFVVTAFLFNTSKVYSKNLANNIFSVFNLILMTSYCFNITRTSNLHSLNGNLLFADIIPFILLTFTAFKLFASYTMFKLEGKNIDFATINTFYIFILSNILAELFAYTPALIATFAVFILFLIINEIKFKNTPCIGKNIFQIILMTFLTLICFEIDFINNYLGLSILALPFIIYGFYSKDNIFKYAGLTALGIYILQVDLYDILHLGIGLVNFAALTYLVLNEKEQYSATIKLPTYILFLIFGFLHIGNIPKISFDTTEILTFMFLSIVNLFAAKSIFKRDFLTLKIEDSTLLLTRIINAGLMLWALDLISDSTDFSAIVQLLIILVSLALFLANTRNLLKKYDGLWAGIYIGIKITILMLVILDAWEASNFIISISCLLLAIFGIVLGFKFDQKSFRIYGLGLAMISTVKLIMVDISYENSIGHALSFFLSGILCFAISAIYNLLDKKFIKENNDET